MTERAAAAAGAWPFRNHLTMAQADAVEAARALAADDIIAFHLHERLGADAAVLFKAYCLRNPRGPRPLPCEGDGVEAAPPHGAGEPVAAPRSPASLQRSTASAKPTEGPAP